MCKEWVCPTTPGYFSRDGANTSGDPAGRTLGKDCGDASPFIVGMSWAEGYPYTFLHNHEKGGSVLVS